MEGERNDDGGGAQYLTFALGDEVFAMDIRTVREIIQVGPMTSVPTARSAEERVVRLSAVMLRTLTERVGRSGRAVTCPS